MTKIQVAYKHQVNFHNAMELSQFTGLDHRIGILVSKGFQPIAGIFTSYDNGSTDSIMDVIYTLPFTLWPSLNVYVAKSNRGMTICSRPAQHTLGLLRNRGIKSVIFVSESMNLVREPL